MRCSGRLKLRLLGHWRKHRESSFTLLQAFHSTTYINYVFLRRFHQFHRFLGKKPSFSGSDFLEDHWNIWRSSALPKWCSCEILVNQLQIKNQALQRSHPKRGMTNLVIQNLVLFGYIVGHNLKWKVVMNILNILPEDVLWNSWEALQLTSDDLSRKEVNNKFFSSQLEGRTLFVPVLCSGQPGFKNTRSMISYRAMYYLFQRPREKHWSKPQLKLLSVQNYSVLFLFSKKPPTAQFIATAFP